MIWKKCRSLKPMNDILDRYLQKSLELRKEGKTGRECVYCGSTKVSTNRYGIFCAGCGAERKKELGTCFGVPVYDAGDRMLIILELERASLLYI